MMAVGQFAMLESGSYVARDMPGSDGDRRLADLRPRFGESRRHRRVAAGSRPPCIDEASVKDRGRRIADRCCTEFRLTPLASPPVLLSQVHRSRIAIIFWDRR